MCQIRPIAVQTNRFKSNSTTIGTEKLLRIEACEAQIAESFNYTSYERCLAAARESGQKDVACHDEWVLPFQLSFYRWPLFSGSMCMIVFLETAMDRRDFVKTSGAAMAMSVIGTAYRSRSSRALAHGEVV
jgi:hypothetical protein